MAKNFKFEKLSNFLICYDWRIWKIIEFLKLNNLIFFLILPFDKIIKFGYSNNL